MIAIIPYAASGIRRCGRGSRRGRGGQALFGRSRWIIGRQERAEVVSILTGSSVLTRPILFESGCSGGVDDDGGACRNIAENEVSVCGDAGQLIRSSIFRERGPEIICQHLRRADDVTGPLCMDYNRRSGYTSRRRQHRRRDGRQVG